MNAEDPDSTAPEDGDLPENQEYAVYKPYRCFNCFNYFATESERNNHRCQYVTGLHSFSRFQDETKNKTKSDKHDGVDSTYVPHEEDTTSQGNRNKYVRHKSRGQTFLCHP